MVPNVRQARTNKSQFIAFKVFQLISNAALAITLNDVGKLAFIVKMVLGKKFGTIFPSDFKNPVS